jgi:hypothetical protein
MTLENNLKTPEQTTMTHVHSYHKITKSLVTRHVGIRHRPTHCAKAYTLTLTVLAALAALTTPLFAQRVHVDKTNQPVNPPPATSNASGAPSVTSVTPINGSGSPQTFTVVYTDPAGSADLSNAYLEFSSSLTESGACFTVYVVGTNEMYLMNETDSGVSGVIMPGKGGSVSNSLCSISDAGPSTPSGNTLTVRVSIAFSAQFIGTKNVYGLAAGFNGKMSGYQLMGTWTPNLANNMTYHGGKIMTTAHSQAIFWGTSWPAYSGDKITGTDSFYVGFSNSNYAKTSDEYTGTNGQVGPTTSYGGHVIDGTAAVGGDNSTLILNEVCKVITNPDPSGNGYYAVYSDVKRNNAPYCAWHSAGTCHGVPVQFAFFFNLDGDAGCDPNDTSGLHSQGLAALANVSAHELSEARTDPGPVGAWYDSSGAENGDKCAWTFNVPLVTFSDGNRWKLQGEWSNAAYTSGTGYPNQMKQRGCLDGH